MDRDRDRPLPDDYDPYRDEDDDMRQTDGGNPWVIGGLALNIVATIVGVAWIQGKNDQRMTTVEREVVELKAKSSKDAAQDIQIAVITTQLSIISTGVSEIKANLEKGK